MSYQAQAQLTDDVWFNARNRSVAVQQAGSFQADQRPGFKAVANECLRGNGEIFLAFTRMAAGGPGIADRADNGDGTIDQGQVADADLLSLTQANWQVVAGLFFDEDGIPLTTPDGT